MGLKTKIATVAAVVAVLLLAAGAYAWDAATKDTIADGVQVGEVDLGGLGEREARRVVREDVVAPYERGIEVAHEDQRFALSSEELSIRGDVAGMVDEALEASRQGGIFGRLFRQVSGGEVSEVIAPRVAYSRHAVNGFVDGISAELNREARDASVEPGPSSVEPISSQDGITLREDQLREEIDEQLQSPTGSSTINARVKLTEPEITTAELAAEYPHYLAVDRGGFKLRYYRNLELEKTYTVAIGQIGYDTPAGLYHIQNKQVDPTWYVPDREWAGKLAGEVIPPGPDNPLKARWMGFYDGAGIHGTAEEDSIGTAASHGCIRMRVTEVKELYSEIPTGTPIYIG
jgi:lipoprotein-anchoring transpeptidase ErfK/SrfK